MNTGSKRTGPATADVYICPCNAGFILSVGPVCLWLERATAEDVLFNLRDALFSNDLGAPDDDDDDDDAPDAN